MATFQITYQFQNREKVLQIEAENELSAIQNARLSHNSTARAILLPPPPSPMTQAQINIQRSAYAPFCGNEKIFRANLDFNNPEFEQLDTFALLNGRVSLGCNVGYEDKAAIRLEGIDLTHCLRIGYDDTPSGQESHGLWMNLFIPDPRMPQIDIRLGLYFNPRPLHKGYYQISRLEYVERLLRKGIRILEIGENI